MVGNYRSNNGMVEVPNPKNQVIANMSVVDVILYDITKSETPLHYDINGKFAENFDQEDWAKTRELVRLEALGIKKPTIMESIIFGHVKKYGSMSLEGFNHYMQDAYGLGIPDLVTSTIFSEASDAALNRNIYLPKDKGYGNSPVDLVQRAK